MSYLKEEMLIKVSAAENNNKFYHVAVEPGGRVMKRWGRVGSNGQTQYQMGGEYTFQSIVDKKMKDGYVPAEVITNTSHIEVQDHDKLSTVAKTVLVNSKHKGNVELDNLIDKLVAINSHEILETSGGLIKINTNGAITTPLGLVSSQSIINAEAILKDIEQEIKLHKDISSSLESYLRVIPQKIPARRGWQDTFFKDDDSFQKQYDFLKQLKASVDWHDTADKAEEKAEEENIEEKYKTLFKSNVGVLDNQREFRKIEKFFKSSVNPMHGNASRLQLKRVFTLTSEVDDKIFDQKAKELGNVQQLWHGTRAFNVLSILRKGLFVPPVTGSGILVTGRMFGNGLYLSSQSSKSLRYSNGGWSGARENNCFMFLTETVMGNTYKPRSNFNNAIAEGNDTHGKPYNSTHIKGGTCGVINDEMIVRDPAQVKLKYLCEFDL